MDLTEAWKKLIAAVDGTASEKQIYTLAEDVLKSVNKPVTKENLDIVIRTISNQIKFNLKD